MSNIDKRNRLDEEPFTYKISKSRMVFISYKGKEIKSVKGKEAEKLIGRLQQAESPKDLQLVLAKATGHFKHGNENMGK
ncbi:hypothetical protein L1279_003757 [Planomicrobium sp. HSC-17F08]|nr:hypothetical protein [Planomicrobium sp. HSC-17F08]